MTTEQQELCVCVCGVDQKHKGLAWAPSCRAPNPNPSTRLLLLMMMKIMAIQANRLNLLDSPALPPSLPHAMLLLLPSGNKVKQTKTRLVCLSCAPIPPSLTPTLPANPFGSETFEISNPHTCEAEQHLNRFKRTVTLAIRR